MYCNDSSDLSLRSTRVSPIYDRFGIYWKAADGAANTIFRYISHRSQTHLLQAGKPNGMFPLQFVIYFTYLATEEH